MAKQNSLKKNAFFNVLQSFFSLIFPVITFPYASRILLPEGIGKVNFANSIVSYVILLGGLGIGSYSIREASKLRDDTDALTKFIKEIFIINIISDAIAYGLFFIAMFCIPKLASYRTILLISSSKLFISTLGFGYVYIAKEEFRYVAMRSFIFQLLSLIYLFTFVKSPDDIIHYSVFGILTSVGSNICNFIHLRKFVNLKFKFKYEFKKHLKPIFVFFGINCVASIYNMLDTAMLGFLSNDVQVGYYSASTKITHMVLSLVTSITTVLLPRLSNYRQNGKIEEFNTLVKKSVSIILLLAIPMSLGLALLSRPLVLLFSGSNYVPAIITMQAMTPILIIISFHSTLGQIPPAINKEKMTLFACICGATVNVITNTLLIPKLGALGAGIGTVSAEFSVALFLTIYLRKFIFHKEVFISTTQSILSTLIMGTLILLFMKYCKNIILQVTISFLLGILIYAASLILFRNKYFLEIINKYKEKLLK